MKNLENDVRKRLIDFARWLYPSIGATPRFSDEIEELTDMYLKSINQSSGEALTLEANEHTVKICACSFPDYDVNFKCLKCGGSMPEIF